MDGHPDGKVNWNSAHYYASMKTNLEEKAAEITDELFEVADTDGDYVLTGDEVHYALEKMINFGEIDSTLAEMIFMIFVEAETIDEESDGASWADMRTTIEDLLSDPAVANMLENL